MNDSNDPSTNPERYFHAFRDAVASYEISHPHWPFEVLVSLIKWGIESVKNAIGKKASGVDWDSPFLELHYPVEWDWVHQGARDVSYGKQIIGIFTKDNTASHDIAAETLAKTLAAHFNTTALSVFTNGARFEIRKGKAIPFLPVESDMHIQEIKNERAKREAAEEMFRPFSIGATRVDPSIVNLKNFARVPQKFLNQLAKGPNFPGVSYKGNINGRQIWAGLIFEVQPLMVNFDKKRAYYPITVGLAFERKFVGKDIISTTPADWPQPDQQIFWQEFLQSIDSYGRELIPENEVTASIILKVNLGLNITRTISGQKQINEATDWLMNFGGSGQSAGIPNIRELLDAQNSAQTPEAKGRALEALTTALFRSVDGFNIEACRVKTETEEIDLVISNSSNDPRLRREEAIILVECKNWSSKCGKNEFVEFKAKIENRRERCSLGFLVSWNGFADTVNKEMLRGARERLLIVPLDGRQILGAVENGDSFQKLILSAWDESTLL